MVDLTENNATLPPKNHNNPPSELEMLGESLIIRNVQIIRAAEAHAAIVSHIPDHFTKENEAQYITGHISLMQNCQKELERRRKDEKAPYLAACDTVDSFFNDKKNELQVAIGKAKAPLDDWLKRKADAEKEAREREAALLRREQEEALQRAIDARTANQPREESQAIVEHAITMTNVSKIADTLAAAPITTMARTTSATAKSGLVSSWVGTITDIDTLELQKLRPYISAAELQAALNRYVKQGGRQLEGALIKEVIETKVK